MLITGGAGFIGSKLVKFLLEKNNHIIVFDNFSSRNNLHNVQSKHLEIIKGDCSSTSDLQKIPSQVEIIFHLAADPEVRLTMTNAASIFKNNIISTYNLLEWASKTAAHTIVFTSSSAVYGDATIIPTPESHPCIPISLYGASKVACESLISAYCYTYNKRGIAIRLANIVGPSTTHGILFDMIKKLKNNSKELEILGDGNQNKSYLYIDDCISGIIHLLEHSNTNFDIYNLGSDSQVSVKEIVDIILNELSFSNVKKIFTGGIDGGRGWIGDVKKMLLDINKIKSSGWCPTLNSNNAIRKTVRIIGKDLAT